MSSIGRFVTQAEYTGIRRASSYAPGVHRVLALALAVAACRGDRAPAPAPAPAPVVREAAPQRAPDVELLHLAGAKVAVSSIVANPAISPFDLVDGDLGTAWNSRTGEIGDAYIEVRVPRDAHVAKLRMTAGFTKGDYFTMNHRLREVRVVRGGVDGDLGVHALDPESRTLQDIPIDGPGGDFRIEVRDAIPGTRRDWREICVSELEVWGTPAPGTPLRRTMPEIAIGSLDAAPLPSPDLVAQGLPDYASIEDYCTEFRGPHAGCDPADDSCAACGDRAQAPPIAALPAGWQGATFFLSRAAGTASARCNLAIAADGRMYILEDIADASCGEPVDVDNTRSRRATELHDGTLALTLTAHDDFHTSGRGPVFDELLWLCGQMPPACTPPIQIGRIAQVWNVQGPPGADGLDIETTSWAFAYKLAAGRLELSKLSGKPDDEAKRTLGAHRVHW